MAPSLLIMIPFPKPSSRTVPKSTPPLSCMFSASSSAYSLCKITGTRHSAFSSLWKNARCSPTPFWWLVARITATLGVTFRKEISSSVNSG